MTEHTLMKLNFLNGQQQLVIGNHILAQFNGTFGKKIRTRVFRLQVPCKELDIFKIFWRNFWGEFFWEDFFGRIFWQDFLGKDFLGGFLGGILCLHWDDLLVKILVLIKILSQWMEGRKKEI